MKKNNEFNTNLIKFIEQSTCSYTCVKYIKKILKENGFIELKEDEEWNLKNSKYFIIRNDASIIAIDIPKKYNKSFSIVTSHLDTPSFLLKPNGSYIKNNYLKYNVMCYGGLLNYGWLDHPLSLSGRIIIKKDNKLISKIIDFKKPLLIIPSVAIHQNDSANSNLDLNMQVDMQPILSLTNNENGFNNILKKYVKDEIIDYDLYAYNYSKSYFIGNKNELFISPRIDNLTSVYSSLKAFLNSSGSNIKIFCSFNNEETGSLSIEGADSNFLIDTLKKICKEMQIDLTQSLANSFVISSDNTHAIHPNHSEYADDTNKCFLNKGVCIIKDVESTTNAMSSSIVKTICKKHKIKYQDATAKNDLTPGSTLANISLRHLSVLSIDIGICELAMHSSFETCSSNDIHELYKLLYFFYETILIKENNNFIIKEKKLNLH